MNWVDLVIALALAYFMFWGYRHGLLAGVLELLGIIVSLGIPFLLYLPFSRVLERWGVASVFAPAAAFLIIWLGALIIYFSIVRRLYRRVPRAVRESRINAVLGMLTGLAQGLIVIAIALSALVTLPVSRSVHDSIDRSRLAQPLVNATTTVSMQAADIFGEAIQRAFVFLTIRPQTDEVMDLRFSVRNPTINARAEEEMLRLVNEERTKRGLNPLVMDSTIREVARAHSIDMLKRGYFGHNTPQGISPFQRMRAGGVRFTAAGENIAIAPTVRTAHSGLMRSPGHRENILRPQFRRVGIGAASAGRYGTMFTQNFAN